MTVLEWSAAAIALIGAWLVGSPRATTRRWGFACFLASNVLWVIFALLLGTWGLFTMQVLFCVTSLRGIFADTSGAA